MLNKAFSIAYHAHDGQFDKGGMPYIFHPVMVALNVDSVDEKMVALLHDVVEDSSYSLEDLKKEGFPANVIEAVGVITKKDGESYDSYLEGVKRNDLARKVKIADITHNSDRSRLKEISEKDLERFKKYEKALSYLKS